MLIITVLITKFILVASQTGEVTEYCDVNSKSNDCRLEDPGIKYIFYDVNPPEGFNLRRDVYMRFAIMLSEAHKKGRTNWKLVLPPWYNLYHWKSDRSVPKPWNKFFNLDALKSFAPVVEMHEIFNNTKSKVLELDTLYVLENFEDAFENGVFTEKWQITGTCEHGKKFWGYENITVKEVLCVKFQGKNSKLWELISQHPHDTKIMFAHGEIPLHDTYGTKTYWDCRKSMKFNKKLIKIAKKYMSMHLNCDRKKCNNYLSVHWRRQDFARGRGNEVPTILGTVKQIRKALKKLPDLTKIFIATDASMAELNKLEKELTNVGYEPHFFLPSPAILNEFGDGGVAIIDQIICSRAAYFIGTHESTFTYRIQEEREILGFKSDTTFNRLCPDTGLCEEPSKWTIIN